MHVRQCPVNLGHVQEAQQYWERVLEGVDKPNAVELRAALDLRHLLGLPTSGCARTGQGRSGRTPLFSLFCQIKRQHPTKVVLVRVGEFHECVGLDAVLLVQWAGLNPMGSGNPPRAGCPHMNLRRTLQCLTDANLSVVGGAP